MKGEKKEKNFFVICGTDGSGKATQTALLVKRLRREGLKVRKIDFPRHEEKSAGMIEEYLNGKFGSLQEVGPYRASIFFACDRYAASFKIRKWLEEDCVVISDRYVSANKGHQLGKISDPEERKKFIRWLDDLEYDIFGIPKETLNILLYVPPEIGQKLVDKKGKRGYTDKKRDIHEADLEHLRKAAEAYLYIARRENWAIIDCTVDGRLLSIDMIHELVYGVVKKAIKTERKEETK